VTPKERDRLVRLINRAAELADKLEALLANGAEAGALLGSIANDLEMGGL